MQFNSEVYNAKLLECIMHKDMLHFLLLPFHQHFGSDATVNKSTVVLCLRRKRISFPHCTC